MGRPGITPIVAIILVLLMTVATAGTAFVWFSGILEQTQEETTRQLNTELSVKDIQCEGTDATLAVQNSGSVQLDGSNAQVFLYESDSLIDSQQKDLSGSDFTDVGGFGQTDFTFSQSMEAGKSYRLEVSFQSDGYTLTSRCRAESPLIPVYGDGSDGSVTITATNINTEDISGDGQPDGAVYEVTGIGSNTVDTASAPSALSEGDEVLLINLQGNSTHHDTVGRYEFKLVSSISGSTLTFQSKVSENYDSPSGQGIVVQRVPNYEDVTVDGGTLTASAWDGTSGGVLAFRANGTLSFVNGGSIDADGKGFRGGTCGNCNDDWDGGRGEGIDGWDYPGGQKDYPDEVSLNNVNGGGGNHVDNNDGGDPGAGGGHGTAGETVEDSQSSYDSTGGSTVGNAQLTNIFFGGGGGAGADNDGYPPRPQDSHGGGIIYVTSDTVQNADISAEGVDGTGDGDCCGGASGGGAGGTVYLISDDLGISEVNATGGDWDGNSDTGERGGKGGDGRIRLDYNSITGQPGVDPAAGFESSP